MAETSTEELDERYSWWKSRMALLSWKRTSLSVLATIESKILSCLSVKPDGCYVSLSDDTKRLWTLSLNTHVTNNKTPLVLLHGMGAGVGLWVMNLEALARDRPVYAIDVLGFGRSSRIQFAADAEEVEAQFVDSIEDWRKAVGLDEMIVLGHSLGGYLAASYALQHADRVKHLIFVDPWGFQERPPDLDNRPQPLWVKVVRKLLTPMNPFSALRMAGPWGPSLILRFKADLIQNYSTLLGDNRIADYLYHCNAQAPSGEIAFKTLTQPFGWAKRPMMQRICDISPLVSMTFIHGARSWVDCGIGKEVKYRRSNSVVDFQLVSKAGHHIYADAPDDFNNLVITACNKFDHKLEGLYVHGLSTDCNFKKRQHDNDQATNCLSDIADNTTSACLQLASV